MFSLLKSIHVVADVSFQHMFVHLLLQYHPCKCKILVYFSSSVAVCCCLAVMAGIRFIIFPWCCTDSFSEHPTLGSICIVGDVSHYTVMPAEWLVYTSWRLLCIFLLLLGFTLGLRSLPLRMLLALLLCGAFRCLMFRFSELRPTSSGIFACAWEKKISWVVSGNR